MQSILDKPEAGLQYNQGKVPVKFGASDFGLCKRSRQKASTSGILAIFWSRRTRSRPITKQSENRSFKSPTTNVTSLCRNAERLGLVWSSIRRK